MDHSVFQLTGQDYKDAYATRTISLSPAVGEVFSVCDMQFTYKVICARPNGKRLISCQIRSRNGKTVGAERFVLLIKGLKPVRDIRFEPNGSLQFESDSYIFTTRLVLHNPRKRARKTRQEERRWNERMTSEAAG